MFAPANTIAPVHTVTPSPSSSAPASPFAEEPRARRGRLPSTAPSSIVQPSPMIVPACTTTCAPKTTFSPTRTCSPRTSPGAWASALIAPFPATGTTHPPPKKALREHAKRPVSQQHHVPRAAAPRDAAQIHDDRGVLGNQLVVHARVRRHDQREVGTLERLLDAD